MMRRKTRGYMMLEAVVSMAILSISMIGIHQALRQAVIVRAQAQDYTTARFLLEKIMGGHELQIQVVEGSGDGGFPAPNDRFRYSWSISKVEVPRPPIPDFIPPRDRERIEEKFKGYMARIEVHIYWTRAGREFEAIGETLLPPEDLWLPEEETENGAFSL
jgi:hypothetical protein